MSQTLKKCRKSLVANNLKMSQSVNKSKDFDPADSLSESESEYK